MEPSRPHAPQPQGAGAAPTPRAGPLRGTSTSTGQPAGPLRSVSWRLQKFNFPSRVACPQSPGPPRAPNLCPPAGPQARHPLCRAVGGEGPTPTPALSLQPPQRALQAPLQQSHFPVREAPRVRLRFPLTFISRYCPEPHPLRQKQLPLPLTCAHFPQAGLCPPPAPPPPPGCSWSCTACATLTGTGRSGVPCQTRRVPLSPQREPQADSSLGKGSPDPGWLQPVRGIRGLPCGEQGRVQGPQANQAVTAP